MKILITGGAGFIGSATVRNLRGYGYDITVYDNLSKGYKEAVPPEIEFVQGDLSDKKKLITVLKKGFDCVVHFASYIEAGESVYKPSKYYQNNVINTLSLLQAMVEANVKKIVFSSSAGVYGNPLSVPISEDALLAPVNPYGETKMIMEQMIKEFSKKYNFNAVALRYFNAAGALFDCGESHNPETHIIPRFINAALNEENIFIFGDGSHERDYVHVSDLADAHKLSVDFLLSKKDNTGLFEVFNIGTGKRYSNLELANKIIELVSKRLNKSINSNILFLDSRPGDPLYLAASYKKAKNILGWSPKKVLLDEIISDAIEWHISGKNFSKNFIAPDENSYDYVINICKLLNEDSCLSNLLKWQILRRLYKDEINTIRVIPYKDKSDEEIVFLLRNDLKEKDSLLFYLLEETWKYCLRI